MVGEESVCVCVCVCVCVRIRAHAHANVCLYAPITPITSRPPSVSMSWGSGGGWGGGDTRRNTGNKVGDTLLANTDAIDHVRIQATRTKTHDYNTMSWQDAQRCVCACLGVCV